ncbi:hypothetical protein B0F90DRAFT_1711301 [Multifurca ochricompacta]|uniref:Bestrophin homolog n=1 Tax=Multifurca ochricompacta TaxID=376703 RepID=A0AAD4M885_9AGAM|nr:hypothetical protein B0F90DRAFT_1711301 [Multifurca ochricompacta]
MSTGTAPPSAPSTHRKLFTRKHLRKYSWLPDVLRLKNSIVGHIIGPVFTVTLFSVAVVYAYNMGKPVTLTNSVTPLLAVVVSGWTLFAFGTISSQARNLARLVWIQVALPPADDITGKTPSTIITPLQLRRRKVDALKLILAFVHAIKHYLREEDGLDWDDYAGIIPASFLRAHSRRQSRRSSVSTSYNAVSENGSSPENSRSGSPSRGASTDGSTAPAATKRVRIKRSLDKLYTAKSPLISGDHTTIDLNNTLRRPFLSRCVAHELTRMLFAFRRDGLLETVGPAGVNTMNAIVSGLVDQLTNVERIANTPIPKSYGIHLKQCVTLYLFALPFTLVKELGWATVPIVTVIEMPFGMHAPFRCMVDSDLCTLAGLDESDLPLDRYCSDLREEVNYIIDNLPEGGVGGYGWDDGQGDD